MSDIHDRINGTRTWLEVIGQADIRRGAEALDSSACTNFAERWFNSIPAVLNSGRGCRTRELRISRTQVSAIGLALRSNQRVGLRPLPESQSKERRLQQARQDHERQGAADDHDGEGLLGLRADAT